MPPETATAIATRAAQLWEALEAVYDRLEAHAATGAWQTLGEEAGRLAALRQELAPLMATMVEACASPAGDPVLRQRWRVLEARGRLLVARHRELEELAADAREDVAAELARLRRGRDQTRRYAPASAEAPRFTSRRA
jgi:hypothetical protein